MLSSAAKCDWRDVEAALPGGVDCRLLASPDTTTFENTYREDGTRVQRAPRLATPLPFVADAVEGVDWVHLGPLHPDDVDPAWYRVASVPLALDLQGLTRRIVDGSVEPGVDHRLADWSSRFTWLKGSIREWKLIEDALGASASALGAVAERLVTRGIDGGNLLAADRTEVWKAAPPVAHRDPTGAGDVYFAAYLFERHIGTPAATAAARAARFTSEFLLAR